jgi:short-subunit dehydrogenase
MVQISSYGRWAVVTGASSGIGRAFAEHLAAAGLDLVLAARSTDRLRSLGAALSETYGVAHRVVTVDLGVPGGAAALIEATDGLDVGMLVSNAGTGRPGRFLDQDLDELHRRLTLNTTAHLDLVHAFGRRFVARGRGGIVLMSALGAQYGLPNMAHDGAAKAYVHSLGEALHRELRDADVDVMVALPGNVDTPVLDALGLDRAAMPVRPLPAAAAVREMVAALQRGRSWHILDWRLRAITRLVPRSVLTRMNSRMFDRGARALAIRSAPR